MLCKGGQKLNTTVPWEGYKTFWVQDPTLKPSIILSPQEWVGRTRNSLPSKTKPRLRLSLAALETARKTGVLNLQGAGAQDLPNIKDEPWNTDPP